MTQNRIIRLPYEGEQVRISARVRLTGSELVVFLHGLGCAKESFAGAFTDPRLRDFSLCAFDFPGYGASDSLKKSSHSLPTYADITHALLDQISIERIHFVCHSMGGAVGLIATQMMRDVQCYVSVEGNLNEDDCGLVSRRTAEQSSASFVSRGHREFLKLLQDSPRADLRSWGDWYRRADPLAVHQSACSLVEWSESGKLVELFRTSAKRRAYIYGDEDDKAHLRLVLHDVPTYRIPNAGHFSMIDNPYLFYGTLAEILIGAREDGTVVSSA